MQFLRNFFKLASILQIYRQSWWGLLEAAYIIVAIKVETACSASVLVHTPQPSPECTLPSLRPLHPRPDIWNAHNLLFYWTKPLEGPRAAQAAQLQSNRHILPTAPRLGEREWRVKQIWGHGMWMESKLSKTINKIRRALVNLLFVLSELDPESETLR